ncbi:MAG: sulfatase [Gemmatimonadota bacterium]
MIRESGNGEEFNRQRFILLLALTLGVGTGLGEVALFAAQTHILHRFIFVGRDIVWMAPLAEIIVFGGVGIVLVALQAITRWPLGMPSAGILGFLSFLALLMMYTPLHKGAAIVLALGLAVQFVRLAGKHSERFVHLVQRASWVLLAIALMLGTVSRGSRWMQERQTIAALPSARPGAPNILLIILDTARALELSAYGYDRPTTPALEQFARSSVRFDWAFSNAPWTLPSHASLFTGRFPHELSAGWLTALDGQYPTLAETLARDGYRTSGFVGNTLYCDTEKGLDRGFEHWEDYTFSNGELFRSSVLIRELTGKRWARQPFNSYQLLGRKSAADVNRDFLQWVDGVHGRPFFSFLNYFDAHAPYLPDSTNTRLFATPGLTQSYDSWARYRGKPDTDTLIPDWVQDNRDRYDAMLRQIDNELGRLFAELERRGVLENTIVIVSADHGEQFGEHAIMGHGNSLYLPVLHVPLFIRYPRSVPQGATVKQPVSLRDLSATIEDLAGRTGDPLPGRSLARYWRKSSIPAGEQDTLLMEVDYNPRLPKGAPIDRGSMRAVVMDSLHYILNGDQKEELYQFSEDPAERHDIAGTPSAAPAVARHRAALRVVSPDARNIP